MCTVSQLVLVTGPLHVHEYSFGQTSKRPERACSARKILHSLPRSNEICNTLTLDWLSLNQKTTRITTSPTTAVSAKITRSCTAYSRPALHRSSMAQWPLTVDWTHRRTHEHTQTHAHTNTHAHRAAHAYYAKSTCRRPLAAVVAQSASSLHSRYETGPSAVGDGKNPPKW